VISYILVNYNTKALTNQTIESIIKNHKSNEYEIILVDNNSLDGSEFFFTELSNKIKILKYIYNNKNYGFGKANNIGVAHSCGEYIYILNSDTILQTKNIEKIIETKFNQYSYAGVFATKVQYEDGTLQPNVQNFASLKAVFLRLLKVGHFVRNNKILLKFFIWLPVKSHFIKTYLDNFDKERTEEFIQWASGCSLIFKREVYEKLGGFDENFFMYTEDEELCYRVQKAGYQILYTPDILITHFEGKSNTTKSINEFLLKTKVKSEFYYFEKHFPQKINKLKFIYLTISTFGYLFSKNFRVINKAISDLKL
jgi:GT2 family glycosyltransferase